MNRLVSRFGRYYADSSFIFPTYQHERSYIGSAPATVKV